MIAHVSQIATVSHYWLVSSKLPFNFAIWVRVELYKWTQLIHLVCTKLFDQYAKDFSQNIHPWFKTLSAWKIIPGTGLPLILRFLFITLKMRWNWNKISIYCGIVPPAIFYKIVRNGQFCIFRFSYISSAKLQAISVKPTPHIFHFTRKQGEKS